MRASINLILQLLLVILVHAMPPPDVSPDSPIDEQPTIGLIGMGTMGAMYAKYLSEAGWKK
jgi:hypothetical protein